MPIPGQSPLTNIETAKELRVGFQPLLLAEITWPDGTVLRLADENLDATSGGNGYGGHNWKPRIKSKQLGQIQSVSDNGIIQSPQVTLKLADADKFLFTEYEFLKGFKGAKLRLIFVFWDPDTDTFSSNSRVQFVGICNPSKSDYQSLTFTATNLLNLANFNLPTANISRRCNWIFPVDKAARIRAAVNPDSDEFECGYSPDVTDADAPGGSAAARGNGSFTDCDYTWEACIARMGNAGLPTRSTSSSTPVQIERDQSNRTTGRFGGIHYDPPSSWRGRAYTSGSQAEGINQTNEAKFNDYFPMLWGTSFVEPPIMNVAGDPNATRFETVICIGQIHDPAHADQPGPIQLVIVNDFVVPHISQSQDKTVLNWSWINTGGRDGATNKSPIYDGQGDPYGSMAAILVIVPIKVADSNAIPSVRVLTSGPQIRVWASPDPSDSTRVFSDNFAWVMADMLTWCGFSASAVRNDLNLQSFIDASQVSDVLVTYTDLLGNSETHTRYHLGLTVRERRSAAEIVKNVLASGKAMLMPDQDGLLQLIIKQTLGDQQNGRPTGTNRNIHIDSVDGTGADKIGFVAYSFDDSNILRKGPERDSPTTFTLDQRVITDTPNAVTVSFQDEDYSYTTDTLGVNDSEDIARTGQTVNGGVTVEGILNFDQGKRVIETQLAEQYRGNPRSGINGTNDTGGTWIADFETSFKAIFLQIGQIIAITKPDYGLDTQLFRIIAISPDANCERIGIRAQWHEDDWYLDSYGQAPDPLLQGQRRNRAIRPPFGWLPNEAAPTIHDSIFDPTEKTFAISQLYQTAADDSIIAQIQVQGKLPVNQFSAKTSPPYAPVAETDAGGGATIGANHYYFVLVAIDEDGIQTAASFPPAQVTLALAGSVTIPNIYWQDGTSSWKIYGGTNPNKLSLQDHGDGTPSSISLTAFKAADEALPDIQFDHLTVRVKHVEHSGVFGLAIGVFDATTITWTGIGFTVDQWAGRSISIIGQSNTQDALPVWNFLVESNTADTLTLAGMVDLVGLGVKVEDVLIMRTAPDIISANSIGDSQFINSIKYFNPPINISGAAGAPIVLELATPHDYSSGDEVFVSAVGGNTNANGLHTITVPATPDAGYNQTHIILDIDSNGDYSGGGMVEMITHGMRVHAEIGHIVRIIAGTGRGQTRRVIDNDETSLTIDGQWAVIPDVTSIFIVEDFGWLTSQDSTGGLPNSDPTKETDIVIGIDNFLEQVLWVQAFSESSAGGMESIDSDSPGREIYVFGGPGNLVVQYDKATFNVAVVLDLSIDDDVCPHYIVRRAGVPSSCRFQAKIPPTGADAHIDIILTKADGSFTGSIFGSTKIVIPAGSTDLITMDASAFADVAFVDDDILTVNVTQIGSDQAGRVVSIVLKWAVA